jgi:hypothetical protein
MSEGLMIQFHKSRTGFGALAGRKKENSPVMRWTVFMPTRQAYRAVCLRRFTKVYRSWSAIDKI